MYFIKVVFYIDFIYQAIGGFFGYILDWLLSVFHNYGLSIIVFALITKIIVIPFIVSEVRSSRKSKMLQAKQEEIRAKYKDSPDKDKLNEELTKMYIENKYNPVAGCLMQILMFFVLVGIFFAVSEPITSTLHIPKEKVIIASEAIDSERQYKELAILEDVANGRDYSSYFSEEEFKKIKDFSSTFDFFGLNLFSVPVKSGFPTMFLSIACFLIPFLNMNISSILTNLKKKKQEPDTKLLNFKTLIMSIIAPALTFSFSLVVPCAIVIYWVSSSLLAVIQNIIIKKISPPTV